MIGMYEDYAVWKEGCMVHSLYGRRLYGRNLLKAQLIGDIVDSSLVHFYNLFFNHPFCLGKYISRVRATLSNVDMEKVDQQPPLGTITMTLTSRPEATATTSRSPVMQWGHVPVSAIIGQFRPTLWGGGSDEWMWMMNAAWMEQMDNDNCNTL